MRAPRTECFINTVLFELGMLRRSFVVSDAARQGRSGDRKDFLIQGDYLRPLFAVQLSPYLSAGKAYNLQFLIIFGPRLQCTLSNRHFLPQGLCIAATYYTTAIRKHLTVVSVVRWFRLGLG